MWQLEFYITVSVLCRSLCFIIPFLYHIEAKILRCSQGITFQRVFYFSFIILRSVGILGCNLSDITESIYKRNLLNWR